jgi:hypothetical protein
VGATLDLYCAVIGAVIRPLSLIPSLRYTTNVSLGYWLDDRPSTSLPSLSDFSDLEQCRCGR